MNTTKMKHLSRFHQLLEKAKVLDMGDEVYKLIRTQIKMLEHR